MISSLTGTVAYRGSGFLILDVNRIGYKISLPDPIASGLSGEITLYTHHAIRDDGQELFGFTTIAGLELCWRLIDVPGVGPKLAQKIVYGSLSVDEVMSKIENGDVGFLSGISGVGKKTAQKIILELQGKLVATPSQKADDEVVSALVGLGYSKMQAEEALSEMDSSLDVEQRIRTALKRLAK